MRWIHSSNQGWLNALFFFLFRVNRPPTCNILEYCEKSWSARHSIPCWSYDTHYLVFVNNQWSKFCCIVCFPKNMKRICTNMIGLAERTVVSFKIFDFFLIEILIFWFRILLILLQKGMILIISHLLLWQGTVSLRFSIDPHPPTPCTITTTPGKNRPGLDVLGKIDFIFK